MNRYLLDKVYVGISGHRDLKKDKISEYKKELIDILKDIKNSHKDKEIILISPLADGADRLFIYAGMKLGLRYDVLLPMPLKLYEKDFNDNSKNEFYKLYFGARDIKEAKLCDTCTNENISDYNNYRSLQYQKMGRELVDKCDTMIFMFNGVQNNLIGGTADILSYAKNKNKNIKIIHCQREDG
jgi:hypothetical protein